VKQDGPEQDRAQGARKNRAQGAKQDRAQERVIKRYDNRKLYDQQARRYVTLEDLGRMVGEGTDVRVADQKTGEDLTAMVLAQVLLEGIKERKARVPWPVLARLIRLGFAPAAWADGPGEAARKAREEAERIATGLIGRGRLTLEEALALQKDIAGSVHRIVSEAQHGLESRVRSLLDRSEREGGVSPALHTLRERLMSFETYLARPEAAARKPAGKKRAKKR
jgi:polyhydroxyalkanoate synthesis repressor PhaR